MKSSELTIHILTKNNIKTIPKTIKSIKPLGANISITDRGSTDGTIEYCRNIGLKVNHSQLSRLEIRNNSVANNNTLWHFYLEPWEFLSHGHKNILNATEPCYYVKIIQDTIINKEIRLWNKSLKYKFKNFVFETLNAKTNSELDVFLYSSGRNDYDELLLNIEEWKKKEAFSTDAFYYQSCILLTLGKYDEFLRTCEHYLALEKTTSMSEIMSRYYYSMVQVYKNKKVKPALQNLNICLCYKPLMAEFWCLIGDIYYHLLNKFEEAKLYYQNALVLGKYRLADDKFPMDVSKYKDYPNKMIDSCEKIIKSTIKTQNPIR